ncbi:MAG: pyridoxine 5'-phosphate synthase [Acidobacteriota bacterium]
MVRLSVNVNKVATLRNSRGGHDPSVLDAVRVVMAEGARGITVHPRADQRHITSRDVRDLAALLAPARDAVEYNIEGDPRPDLLALVHEVRPHQCTLVPVKPGEITSQAGWSSDTPRTELVAVIRDLAAAGVRVSLFVDPERTAIALARDVGAQRVELYTEPFARAFEQGGSAANESFAHYVAAARYAHECGLGINAGHDLDLANLTLFRTLPHLEEVSIGHALMSRALFVGLPTAVRDYLAAVAMS